MQKDAVVCCILHIYQAQALELAVKRFSKLEDAAHEAQLATEVQAVSGAYLCTDLLKSSCSMLYLHKQNKLNGSQSFLTSSFVLMLGSRMLPLLLVQDIAALVSRGASEAHREVAALKQLQMALQLEASRLSR